METTKVNVLVDSWNQKCMNEGRMNDIIYPNNANTINKLFGTPAEAVEALLNGGDDCFVIDEGFLILEYGSDGKVIGMQHIMNDELCRVCSE